MNILKRFWIPIFAVALAIALPYSVRAQNWAEVDVGIAERINGKFDPNLKIAVLNYIDYKAIGGFFSTDGTQAGPQTSWRVYQRIWPSGWGFAAHVLASTNLVDGNTELTDNMTGGLDLRLAFPDMPLMGQINYGDVEVSVKAGQFTFIEGKPAEWAIGLSLCFWPTHSETPKVP